MPKQSVKAKKSASVAPKKSSKRVTKAGGRDTYGSAARGLGSGRGGLEESRALGIDSEIGEPGLYQFSGRITDEILRELTGVNGAQNYRQMADNDATIGALLFAIDQIIRSVQWKVLPSDSKNKKAVDNAEFVTECMHDMSDTWEDTVCGIMTFLTYGFSIHEIVYKKRNGTDHELESDKSLYKDGKIGWKRLPIRSQESILRGWWIYDDNNIDIIGVNQLAPPDYKQIAIPWEKVLHFRTTNFKSNPEGKSILRNAFRPWYFKRNIENIEGIGVERELAGLPIMYIPAELMAEDATPQEKSMYASLKDIVTNVRKDEQAGIILPGNRDDNGERLYDLSLLSSNGAKMFDTNKIIQRYKDEILSTVIADFISLGQGVAGTQALAQTKVDLFLNAIQSWVNQISAVFNRFGIPRLMEVNGIKDNIPKLSVEKVKKSDIDQFSKNILILSQAGMDLFPSESMEEFIREEVGLPKKAPEDEEFFNTKHELELENLDPKIPEPHLNNTTGKTGAENPASDNG